jgi:hypothetical protein
MKTYIISKKKNKKKTELKTSNKFQMRFLGSRRCFFCNKNGGNDDNVNPVDLIVSFPS